MDWRSIENPDAVLKTVPLDDVWGISRRWKDRLNQIGIQHALDLKDADPKRLRQQFGVVMERIVDEVRGVSCIALEEMPAPKKQIMTSRSFGEKLTEFDDLRAAITHFATRSAEKCRQQGLATHALLVFIQTSPFDTNPQYSNSATTTFEVPTNDSSKMVAAALQGLKRIYRSGFHYQKAGVLLPDLWAEGVVQTSLFDTDHNARSDKLMAALDDINRRHGKQAIRYASEAISTRWHMRQQFKSPSYTTSIKELWTIQI
ncbi:MAG: DUF4113 domain-containing protein [Methylomonas sp.]|nr:DUF4113 domain-containing protein [Methylomonas sp.]